VAWKVVVAQAATQDLAQSYDWYKTKSPSAAKAFRVEVLAAFDLIARAPEQWTLWDDTVRRYVLKQFPYTVYFEILGNELRILAVGHHRRRPGVWKSN
jgi:toxin ParE1/3/4